MFAFNDGAVAFLNQAPNVQRHTSFRREVGLGWHRKYWDTLDQLYWSPKMLGLKSIPKTEWGDNPETIAIDRSRLANGASIYFREGNAVSNRERMQGLEETLNHIFDITFAIAPSRVISSLLCQPLGIDDRGPFERIGREVRKRYPDLRGNSTQQDGFFVSEKSLVGVELKLGAPTSKGQVLKYLALMVCEERLSGQRINTGLLYITPNRDPSSVFDQSGVGADGNMPSDFVFKVPESQRNQAITQLLNAYPDHFSDVASRLVVAHISWRELAEQAKRSAKEASVSDPPDETLYRLLSGFSEAIAEHHGTRVNLGETQSG